MSTYAAAEGVFPGRPPCATCGAAWRLHGRPGPRGGLTSAECPQAYRPSSLEVAQRELAAAQASGDEARVFVARGEVQRLEGRRA